MNGLIKDNFVYLITAKNGSTTYSNFLAKHGWEYVMLTDDHSILDLSKCVIWGHITEPFKRHTKGVVEYLRAHPELDIDNSDVARLLVSGVYDCHTYTLSMIYAPLIRYDIEWIPLDHDIVNYLEYPHKTLSGDDLTNNFFKEHNLGISITAQDHKWRLGNDPSELVLREKIDKLKEAYSEDFIDLRGNIIEHDVLLYNKAIEKMRRKYGSKE
jgi:hypothetical protein